MLACCHLLGKLHGTRDGVFVDTVIASVTFRFERVIFHEQRIAKHKFTSAIIAIFELHCTLNLERIICPPTVV